MQEHQISRGLTRWGNLAGWCQRQPRLVLAALTLLALAPFLAKPFHIDDPLFVWAAQQVWVNPANPYGFEVNWFGSSQTMWAAMQNPPLMAYYLALAAGFAGWSEFGLHFACSLIAVAAVLGTLRLAQNFCQRPMLAALLTLFAPGFLVSSTTLMCDVLLLAFWVWAAVFWTEGIRQEKFWKLSVAGALAALALLAKYNGLCLIPLLAAHGWVARRSAGRWLLALLIPLAVWGAYEWLIFSLYGQSHFSASNQYAQTLQTHLAASKLVKLLNVLTFTGGCFAGALLVSPFLWARRTLLLFFASAILFAGLAITDDRHLGIEMQTCFWTTGGLVVLALGLADVWQRRDAGSCLLILWVMGTLAFATHIYWMVNARVLLPLAPAVAILIARRLDQKQPGPSAGLWIAGALSAALSLLAAQADFQMAGAARKLAGQVAARHAGKPGKIWFDGHWGFQYYLQLKGGRPVDTARGGLAPGDWLVVPAQNANAFLINPANAGPVETLAMSDCDWPWFATFNYEVGAGFYSQFWGPLPFAFGHVPPATVAGYVLKNP